MTQKKPTKKVAVLKTEDPIEETLAQATKRVAATLKQPETSGLITVPNPILRKKSKLVTKVTPAVGKLADEMIDYMLEHKNDPVAPVSTSAPQFGKNIQLVVFYRNYMFRERSGIETIINPVLSKLRKYHIVRETCLSIPGRAYYVRRARYAKVSGQNLDGNSRTYKGNEIEAQVFQHEVDHLNGILIDESGQLVPGGV